MRYKKIKIQNIRLDQKPFSFSFPEFDPILLDSISDIGLINPVILLPEKKSANFFVVSGLRRVLACKKLGMKTLPSFILKENERQQSWSKILSGSSQRLEPTAGGRLKPAAGETQQPASGRGLEPAKEQDYESFIFLNLRINLSHRELNDIEKAHLLKLLNKAGLSHEKIIKKYMPLLKLEKSRKIYEDMLRLHSLDIRTKTKIIQWRLPLQTSAALAAYSKADRDSVLKLAETLSPGINRLKEIMMLLEEIAIGQKYSITDIIDRHLASLINGSKIVKKERIEMVRQKLRVLRYPQLTKLEKKWNDYVRDLHLPPEIKIKPPLSFEGKTIKLEISFSTKRPRGRNQKGFRPTYQQKLCQKNEMSQVSNTERPRAAASLRKIDEIVKSGLLEKLIRMVNK